MKIQLDRFFFVLYLLLMNSFLFLHIKQITAMQLTAVVVILYNMLFLKKAVNIKSSYKKPIYLLLCYIMLELFITKLSYSQSITIINMLYRCIEFFSFPFLFILLSSAKNKFCWCLKCIKRIGALVLFALVIVALLYTLFNVRLIEEVFERAGRARILYGFEFLTIVWLLYLADICKKVNLKQKINIPCILFLIVEFIYQIVFVQVRILVLYHVLFVAIAILFVIKSKNKKIVGVAVSIIVSCIFLILPITSNYLDKILEMFSASDSSMYARMSQLNYYPNLIRKRLFWGYGTISGKNFSGLITGEYGVFCPEDLGLIGFSFFYGLPGVMIYMYIILANFVKSISNRFNCPEVFFMEIFLILSSATMLMLDIQRGPLMILFLYIIEGGLKSSEDCTFRRNEK